MEAVVRVVTFTGERTKPKKSENESSALATARHWDSLKRTNCVGRFVPDTETDNAETYATRGDVPESVSEKEEQYVATLRAKEKKAASDWKTNPNIPYKEWLRLHTTQSVDTEVNIQLGEFTLKKHQMQLLSERTASSEDFVAMFGEVSIDNAMQSAEVYNTTNRMWVRLVGRRHDVQHWVSDKRLIKNPNKRRLRGGVGGISGLKSGENWIMKNLERAHPQLKMYFSKLEMFLPDKDFSNQTYARLTAVVTETVAPIVPTKKEVKEGRCFVHIWGLCSVFAFRGCEGFVGAGSSRRCGLSFFSYPMDETCMRVHLWKQMPNTDVPPPPLLPIRKSERQEEKEGQEGGCDRSRPVGREGKGRSQASSCTSGTHDDLHAEGNHYLPGPRCHSYLQRC